jgi:probable addiction module antidote protein
MVKRSVDWNEGLAEDLRDPEFAREFLLAAVDEGVAVQKALGKVIRAMGVKEYADKAGIASPNVLRAIRTGYNPTQATLDRMLRPFGLKLSVAPIRRERNRRAA